MHRDTEPWVEAVRTGSILVRWRTRIFVRALIFHVHSTLHGKLALAGAAIMAATVLPIVAHGFLEIIPPTTTGLDGLLLVAHLWLAVPLSLMILTQFTKAFVKQRVEDPLAVHPALLPGFARHRVIAAIAHTALAFVGLFYGYFWQILSARLDRLWLTIPIHLLTTALLVFTSGILMGSLGRHLLPGVLKRGMRNPDALVNLCGGIAMAPFALLLLGIVIASKHMPGIFEALGNSVVVSVPIGMIPFATALAADEGRWLTVLGWSGLSAGMAFWAAWATYHWSFSAHREIPADLTTPARRYFAPVFTGFPSRSLPNGVSTFWRKDIVVPYSREPKRYLFHQINLLWWGVMAVVLAMALRNCGSISAAFADTIPVLMTLFAMAVLAMQNGVNALGREGKELTWLRPILTGVELFVRKLVVNWTYVLVHGVAYAFFLYTASRAASLNTSAWALISYAIGAGGVFSCLATAIGFLLPDFERRRSSLPGSTGMGKFGYVFGALSLAGITSVAHLLVAAGSIDGGFYTGLLTFALLCAAVAMSVITAAAMRQFRGMEI